MKVSFWVNIYVYLQRSLSQKKQPRTMHGNGTPL
jgi:hypothetical protein